LALRLALRAELERARKPLSAFRSTEGSNPSPSAEVRDLQDVCEIFGGDLGAEIAKLKARNDEGTVLVHGGPDFAKSLTRRGLVDEYQLMTVPIAIGAGHSPFSGRPRPGPVVPLRSHLLHTAAHLSAGRGRNRAR
jgi:riboflavin biosynthesis pyrimidine reductase